MLSNRSLCRVLALATLATAPQAFAEFLIPTGVSVSGWWNPTQGGRDNVINGSGLSEESALGTHDNNNIAETMWFAGVGEGVGGGPPVVADQFLIFDLGASYDLSKAYIWQMNQGHPAAGGLWKLRGTENLEILVSSDEDPTTATFTSVTNATLQVASGFAGEPAQEVAVVASNVRLVMFDIQTALSGAANEYVGLSEVRFEGRVSSPDDEDGDGLPDDFELAHSSPPSTTSLNPGDDLENGGAGDGLTNLQEFENGTDPNEADTDVDGLEDGAEVAGAGSRPPTDPTRADTDNDGLDDGAESNTGSYVDPTDTGSNPTLPDTDGDGIGDGDEVAEPFSDPTDAADPGIELVGLWRFEDNFSDSSPQGNDGVGRNGVTFAPSLDGHGMAGSFSGLDTYVEVPDHPSLDLPFRGTIAAWVNHDNIDWEGILAKAPADGALSNRPGNYELRLNASTKVVELLYQPTTGDANAFAQAGSSPGTLFPSTWTHVAVTVSSSGEVTYYLDGFPMGTGQATNFGRTNDNPLYLGSRGDFFTDFNGLLDDVAIFNGVLSEEQIGVIMTGNFDGFGLGDSDGDGLPDSFEQRYTDPPSSTALEADGDEDGDGLTNLEEFELGIDPTESDSDGDGLSDGDEVAGAGERPATDPNSADTDGDGLDDGVESNSGVFNGENDPGTDPTKTDTDEDG